MIDPEPTPWRRPLGRWNAAAVRRSIPTRPDHRVACSVAVLRFADVVRPRGAFGIENPGDSRAVWCLDGREGVTALSRGARDGDGDV
jgi:hypothetical protein